MLGLGCNRWGNVTAEELVGSQARSKLWICAINPHPHYVIPLHIEKKNTCLVPIYDRIDTPGVIERVSALFHGNPSLIQGFNTFLPPGYRIEMSDDPRDPDIITVTTPEGTTTTSTHTFGHHHSRAAPVALGVGPLPFVGGSSSNGLPGSRSNTPHSYPLPLSYGHVPSEGGPGTYSPGLQGASTKAAASFLENLNNRNVEKQQTGEFNHAILYLNKIKARYTDDPDKYKNFLEILQTYQKEQRGLNDVRPISFLPIPVILVRVLTHAWLVACI